MTSNQVQLSNVDGAGLKILFLHFDVDKCQNFEARSELDDDLLRIQVYSASTLENAKSITRKFSPEIVFLPNKLETFDSIDVLNEIKHLNNQSKFILVSDIFDLDSLRMSILSGNLINVCAEKSVSEYKEFKSEILSSIRVYNHKFLSNQARINKFLSLANAILIRQQDSNELIQSKNLIASKLLSHFDFNIKDKQSIILASCIYDSQISIEHYSKVLDNDDLDVLQIIRETDNGSRIPASSAGFIVKFTQLFVVRVREENTLDQILQYYSSRPNEIKHPSIRILSQDLLTSLYNSIVSRTKLQKVAGE